jgi:predicted transcriptional regulator
LHILSEILEQCKTPRTRTAIMKKINTNQKMLITYLEQLQEAKLLETHFNETSHCITTPKGKEYLQKFQELQKIVDFSSTNHSSQRREFSLAVKRQF